MRCTGSPTEEVHRHRDRGAQHRAVLCVRGNRWLIVFSPIAPARPLNMTLISNAVAMNTAATPTLAPEARIRRKSCRM